MAHRGFDDSCRWRSCGWRMLCCSNSWLRHLQRPAPTGVWPNSRQRLRPVHSHTHSYTSTPPRSPMAGGGTLVITLFMVLVNWCPKLTCTYQIAKLEEDLAQDDLKAMISGFSQASSPHHARMHTHTQCTQRNAAHARSLNMHAHSWSHKELNACACTSTRIRARMHVCHIQAAA